MEARRQPGKERPRLSVQTIRPCIVIRERTVDVASADPAQKGSSGGKMVQLSATLALKITLR